MRFNKLSITCIAFVALLAGCSDRNEEASIATAPSNEAESAAAAPLKAGPVSLDEMLGSSVKSLHELNGEDLEKIDGGMSCSLDSVNKLKPGMAPIAEIDGLTLSGWVQRKAAAKDQLLVVLRGKKSYGFAAVVGGARPDVAKAINVEEVADFVASSGLNDVVPDEYSVYFVRTGESGLAKCVADAKLTVQ